MLLQPQLVKLVVADQIDGEQLGERAAQRNAAASRRHRRVRRRGHARCGEGKQVSSQVRCPGAAVPLVPLVVAVSRGHAAAGAAAAGAAGAGGGASDGRTQGRRAGAARRRGGRRRAGR